jgi:hypothetical protein
MKRFTFVLVVIGIALGLTLRGSFIQNLLCMAGGIYLGLPALLYFFVVVLSSEVRGRSCPGRLISEVKIVSAIGSSVAVSFLVGKLAYYYDIKNIRRFVEEAVPVLDLYYEDNGEFPVSLTSVTLDRKKPKLLKYSRTRKKGNGEFSFYYTDPAGMMDGYGFGSREREWFYAD